MKNAPRLFWLASYPKSGNTWTRAFIANLLNEDQAPVDINTFNTGAIASGRGWVQQAFDFNINELSHDEIDQLRPLAYQWLSDQATEFEYHKTHDAYSYIDDNKTQPLFPIDATAGALVIVRNPLDVAISFAHHNHCSIDQSIENMCNPNFAFCGKANRLHNQLRQWLWTWSSFNKSWINAPIHKCMVRYEDMKQTPLETFTKVASFLNLPNNEEQIAAAIEKCKIENLQNQEKETPFIERSAKAASFFRKGIVGDWKSTLTKPQIDKIIESHHELMVELNYLDCNGNPM